MKRLYLLRHAKSSWKEPGLDDHDRPLAPRGRRAAKAMGRFLAAAEVCPDLVLCSSACRARQTSDRVVRQLDADLAVECERGLYLASLAELLERIRSVADGVDVLMMVGHEPGMSQLTGALAAPDGSAARRRMERKFPTGACAEIHFSIRKWSDITPESGELRRFSTPRDLE